MSTVYQRAAAKFAERRPTDHFQFMRYTATGKPIRKAVTQMYIQFQYTLFFDPQTAVPEEYCKECGCECYAPGLNCLRCERRRYVPDRAEPKL